MIDDRPPQLYGSSALTATYRAQVPYKSRSARAEPLGRGTRLIDMTAFPHMKSRAVTTHRRTGSIALAGLAVAALAGLAACNTAGSTGSSPGASAPPIVTTPAPSGSGSAGSPSGGSGCPKNLVIPSTDNARTFCVAVGGTVTITATPDQAQGWLPFDNTGTALALAASTPAATGSAKVLAAFTAASPGTSMVSSSHRNCPPASPGGVSCHSIALWKVTITVK
jgi:hypothetical protein